MFWQGILVALVTGAIWCGVGVAYSRAAEKKEGFHLFLLLSALCFLLTSWGAERPGAAPLPELLTVAALMIPAGLLSQFGFLALCGAMRRGSHGVSWGIAQSAMLCPFAAGILLFGEAATPWRLAGMAILLGSLVPLGWPSCTERAAGRAHRIFLLFAFLAFLLLGAQQTLTLVPNRLPGLGPAALSWRIPLLSLGGLIWIVVVIRRRELGFRSVLPLALLYGVLVAAGQWTMFRAIDLLSHAGAAGVAYPVAIGGCIALFFLYAKWIRGEKTGVTGTAGILLAGLGILLLAC